MSADTVKINRHLSEFAEPAELQLVDQGKENSATSLLIRSNFPERAYLMHLLYIVFARWLLAQWCWAAEFEHEFASHAGGLILLKGAPRPATAARAR
jgi:hypothetical protein